MSKNKGRDFLLKIGLFLVVAVMISPVTGALSVRASGGSPINVWWPTNLANVSGIQPFKAMLENADVNSYYMFWEVGNGQYNMMPTNTQDYPHKETSVDLSSWNWDPSGNYTLTFIAQDLQGKEIARTSVQIHVQGSAAVSSVASSAPTVNPTSVVTPTPVANPTPVSTPAPVNVSVANNSTDVFQNQALYVDPQNSAEHRALALQNSDPYDASLLKTIGNASVVQWFGNWNGDVAHDVDAAITAAQKTNTLPVFVAYNIPDRDCGGYSANNQGDTNAYEQWISSFASGIRGRDVAIILEPDAISQIGCLSQADQQTRYKLLNDAVSALKGAGASVYLDAGHPDWIPASTMANDLLQAGIAKADGFSLNVSNFYSTSDNIQYGQAISALVGGKHFVIDTSRNGNGAAPNGQWCNPSGRAIGELPTTNTGNSLADAFLWTKPPGESDGTCMGGPSAGTFWDYYAEQLVANAHR